MNFDPSRDLQYPEMSVDSSDYAEVLESFAPTITTKITEQQQPGESWIDSLARLLPILATTEQQRELLQVQVERAKQGLPPLNVANYGTGVNVGISPDVKQLLMWGGIGALALGFFASRQRR